MSQKRADGALSNAYTELEFTLRRARKLAEKRESARAHAHFAHARRLAETIGVDRSEHLALLRDHLDHCEDWLSRDAPELIEVAQALDRLAGGRDARALHALGLAGSLAARRACVDNPEGEDWMPIADRARAQLERAAELAGFDPDVWGTLAGLLKRMGIWQKNRQETEAADRLLHAAAEAYASGWRAAPDPYPLLNFIELHAYLAPFEPVVPDELADALTRALHHRRHQYQSGKDAHWAAFDLCRGLYWQTGRLTLHLEWLDRGIEKASALDPSSRRHALRTTALSLELAAQHHDLAALADSVTIINERMAADASDQAQWAPRDRRPLEELAGVRADLGRLRKELEAPKADIAKVWHGLQQLLAGVQVELRAAEEEALTAEIVQFREDLWHASFGRRSALTRPRPCSRRLGCLAPA